MQPAKYKMTSYVSFLQASEWEYTDRHGAAGDSLSCSCGEIVCTVSRTIHLTYHIVIILFPISLLLARHNIFIYLFICLLSRRNVAENYLAGTIRSI